MREDHLQNNGYVEARRAIRSECVNQCITKRQGGEQAVQHHAGTSSRQEPVGCLTKRAELIPRKETRDLDE